MRAVSPGASATVRFSSSGFSSSGLANSSAVTNLGLGMLARSTVCVCFNSEHPEDDRRAIDLVRDELAPEAGRQLPVERRA